MGYGMVPKKWFMYLVSFYIFLNDDVEALASLLLD